MATRLSGTGLFLQAIQGITSNYANLMVSNTNGGLTLEDIKNPSSDVNKNSLNASFVSYLATNFGSFDKDSDGIITEEEIQNYTNSLSQNGLTVEQLTQLCAQSGGTNTLLETVLNNFNKIDKNHDGRVTNEEIALYGIDEEIEGVKDKYKRVDESSTASIFYPAKTAEEDEEV